MITKISFLERVEKLNYLFNLESMTMKYLSENFRQMFLEKFKSTNVEVFRSLAAFNCKRKCNKHVPFWRKK